MEEKAICLLQHSKIHKLSVRVNLKHALGSNLKQTDSNDINFQFEINGGMTLERMSAFIAHF